MAITKIKALKKTLNKAIHYIINPDKTEDGNLVYSFGCSVGTADLEMELTAKQGSGNGNRIAYHVIQSFSPDDSLTPERALELGKEFAAKITNGKYEFVVATHVDGNQIHNHIIFNAVNFVDHKKYHYGTKEKYRIREINDEICKENNLSVLPKYDGKRKNKYENKHKKQEGGWTKKLKEVIDNAIQKSTSFDEFLSVMNMEGYEIKRGKHIAFHAPGQERKGNAAYTRSKSIGDNYTEEAIRSRIEHRGKDELIEKSTSFETAKKEDTEKFQNPQISKTSAIKKMEKEIPKINYQKRINLLVDISKNVKAQQSKGYEQALARSNINTLTKTMNYLIEHKITTSDEFAIFAEGMRAEYSLNRKSLRKIEDRLLDLSQQIKFTQNYKKYMPVFLESKRTRQKEEFYNVHKDEIALFKASEIYFERNQMNPRNMNLSKLFEEYKTLRNEKEDITKHCHSIEKSINELERVKQNIETALGVKLEDRVENPSTNNDNRNKELRDKDSI
ncbi:MAG: relaxase/mobilization nuclease domain-containing protein [Ruminococcus flavefaciens]|nr:relaxase/mobilization nuclease domain-containing protein [Ruminococcus flavefaciens]